VPRSRSTCATDCSRTTSYPEVGFVLLRAALERQAAIATLDALPSRTDEERRRLEELRVRLAEDVALAVDLVALARAAGVTSWLPAPAPAGP
jgi:hypothetical protein